MGRRWYIRYLPEGVRMYRESTQGYYIFTVGNV